MIAFDIQSRVFLLRLPLALSKDLGRMIKPQVALVVKNLPANAGDARDVPSTPGSGRAPGEGSGNSLQYSRLENPMDGGAWWATVHRVAESWTRLKRVSTQSK